MTPGILLLSTSTSCWSCTSFCRGVVCTNSCISLGLVQRRIGSLWSGHSSPVWMMQLEISYVPKRFKAIWSPTMKGKQNKIQFTLRGTSGSCLPLIPKFFISSQNQWESSGNVTVSEDHKLNSSSGRAPAELGISLSGHKVGFQNW